MTVILALLVVLVPASVTLIGYWFKQQADKRLSEEQNNRKSAWLKNRDNRKSAWPRSASKRTTD